MSDKNLKQRINMKFCVKIGNSASEMLAILTLAYGEYTMKESSVFERHMRLKKGGGGLWDDPRNGQPKTQTTDANVDSTNLGTPKSRIRCGTNSRRRLRGSVGKKRRELRPDKWILRHDSAPELTSGFSAMTVLLS
jgi:hypothetical protein